MALARLLDEAEGHVRTAGGAYGWGHFPTDGGWDALEIPGFYTKPAWGHRADSDDLPAHPVDEAARTWRLRLMPVVLIVGVFLMYLTWPTA